MSGGRSGSGPNASQDHAMNLRRWACRAGATVLTALLLAGCASGSLSPDGTPITDMSQIEGKWQGTITLGFNGPQQLYYLQIYPGGTFTAQWGMNWQSGRITLTGGPLANFQMYDTSTGTVRYYAGPGERSLSLQSTFGNWSVYVTPVK